MLRGLPFLLVKSFVVHTFPAAAAAAAAASGAAGGAYAQLLDADDEAKLPVLREFQQIIAYKRAPTPQRDAAELRAYYDNLIRKYLSPDDRLLW